MAITTLSKAMQSVGRLPMILNALQSAYDLVVIDSGPATVAELKHFLPMGRNLFSGWLTPMTGTLLQLRRPYLTPSCSSRNC